MIRPAIGSLIGILALGAACAPVDGNDASPPPSQGGSLASGTRPAGEPDYVTISGVIGDGVECPVITTLQGDVYSLSGDLDGYSTGDFVEAKGELADASFCMQGKGTLIVESISGEQY